MGEAFRGARSRTAALLLALLLAAAALRLPGLGDESLWFDEIATARAVAQPTLERAVAYARHRDSTTPPLYTLVLFAWTGLAGTSAWALRIPSVALGLLGIAGLWAGARRWVGAPAAWIAAGLAAASPYLVRYDREARAYALAFALASLAGWLLARLFERPSRERRWLFALVTALLLLTHYSGYWVAAAWLAAGLLARRRDVVLAAVAAGAATLPVPLLYTDWEVSRRQTAWLAEYGWRELATSFLAPGLPLPPPDLVFFGGAIFAALMLIAAAAAGVAFGRGGRPPHAAAPTALALWLAVPLLAPFLAGTAFGRPFGGHARYAIAATPALFSLIGWGLTRLPRRQTAVVAVVGIACLGAASAALVRADEKHAWDRVAAVLADRRPEDPIFVEPEYERLSLRFVLGAASQGVHPIPRGGIGGALRSESPDRVRHAWWVVSEDRPEAETADPPAALRSHYAVCRRVRLPGVTVRELAANDGVSDPCRHGAGSTSGGSRTVEFAYTVTVGPISAGGGPIHVFVPLARESGSQRIASERIEATIPGEVEREDRYGNRFWHGRVAASSGEPISVRVVTTVEREVVHHPAPLPGGRPLTEPERRELALYLGPNRRVLVADSVLDPIVAEIRRNARSGDPAALARATYDWVVDNLEYKKVGTGWGDGDTVWACNERYGNCTDFHALFISLARTLGIPARFEIGFPLPEGSAEAEIGGYHCWVEFYLPETGWFPIDASEAFKHPDKRELFYGNQPTDRIHFTTGRDLQLGADHRAGPLNYFVYPYVEVDGAAYSGAVERSFRFREVAATAAAVR